MELIQNFPFFTIILSFVSAIAAFALRRRGAKAVVVALLGAGIAMSLSVLLYNYFGDGYFVYRMGHYDAPIGNEIAAGLLEPFFALLFELVLLCCLLGGEHRIRTDVEATKQHFYYAMVALCHVALMALCYTNDIFTGYVFVEICTLASCSLLMIRGTGRSLVAATRYMIFSLIGSGLFLIGIILLYSVTGHLLFPQMYATIGELWAAGDYREPLTVSIGLMVSGLAIKSGMFPFHYWMPDTYGTATPASSGILSGVISKGYLFLLIKVIYRVVGAEVFAESGIPYILFIFGILGMIFGSLAAIRADNVYFMVAYSSAAQIGYVYMGLGLGTELALCAALFQMAAHALTKPLLFLASGGLSDSVYGKQKFKALRGSAHNNRMAGFAFGAGALSMIGIPIFAGFVPKMLFGVSAFGHGFSTYAVLGALAVSTILNVIYFMRTTLNLYAPRITYHPTHRVTFGDQRLFSVVVTGMVALNVVVGLHSQPIMTLLQRGIDLFLRVR